MRLLFVHDQFGGRGGAESNIYDTAGEFKRRGHVVGILHGPGTGQAEAEWRETFEHRFSLKHEDQVAPAAAAVQMFQPDVIYVHKLADLETLQTLVDSGVSLVRMVHDHDIYCMRSYKYHPLSRANCHRAASPYCIFPCGASIARNRGPGLPIKWVSYADKKREIQLNQQFQRMMVYSQYMKDELIRNGFDARRIEIHIPLHPEQGHTPRSSFSDRNLVLFVGQLIRGKGVDILLEALAQVQAPFECLILGDGSHRAFCENLCRKLSLGDRVHFCGLIKSEDLVKYYLECSVALVSSVWPEPFGMVGPEAMRHGLPVVAFDVGGVSEWLMDGVNGYLVPRMDRARFAVRVQELLRDKTLARRMGERGREMVRQKHDSSKQITALEHMFDSAISETGCPIHA
jgi:glycosyltransferase involved in cell wall biosynthesis